MRIRGDNCDVMLCNRPFAGALGASLYVGTSGPASIRYRRIKCVGDGVDWVPITLTETIDPGAATVPKCLAVDQVKSPIEELTYNVPSGLLGSSLSFQVRTNEADYENETVYRPRTVTVTDEGTDGTQILGTALVTDLEKLDGGGVRISWVWQPDPDGVQPLQFVVTKTSGSGTVANVLTPLNGGREYQCDVTGLSDGVAYTFRLDGETPFVTTTLIAEIDFTGDASGPPEVTGLAAVEV